MRVLPTRSCLHVNTVVRANPSLVMDDTRKTQTVASTNKEKEVVMEKEPSQETADSKAGKEMVLVGNPSEGDGVEDEDFNFDPEAYAQAQAPVWYAMACFYSCIQNPKGLFD